MDAGSFFRLLQRRLNEQGENLSVDGDFGPKTKAALEKYDVEIEVKRAIRPPSPPIDKTATNPAYEEAKKYIGKGEGSPSFVAWLSKFWPKVGLPSYKTIIGSSFAWCALFFFAMNSEVGQNVTASAGAKQIGQTSGYTIDWKKDGIPEGAGVWKNSSSCSSGSGNHITWSNGSCTPEDLAKPGATWPGLGGNQGNAVKRSIYCAKGDCGKSRDVICRVFWHNKNLPGRVKRSVNCTGTAVGESTR